MKKFLVVSIAILSLLVVGCGKDETNKNNPAKKTEEQTVMETYAKDYYIKFMNKYLTNPTVTLEALKKAKNDGYTDYDLSKLSKCKDTSYVELQLEEGTNEIIGYKHHLDCN